MAVGPASCLLLAAICTLAVVAHPATMDSGITSTTETEEGTLTPDILRRLAAALYEGSNATNGEVATNGGRRRRLLQRKLFYNSAVTCNDGSAAGYYIRRSLSSQRWIVFLEGKLS